ncbi:MAG: flagellar biosynthesis protein FlgJ [Gammaproteobacteria bacterium]|nr:flagellar biosynthesis protein FlgJ [Gammaproteobacteria bacterium]
MLDDRARLAALANTSDEALSRADRRFLAGLVDRYEIDTSASSEDQRAELMVRLDTVPMSLALTQAAMESAWGTSRFAREGNNLFGQWCYQPGCGIVPKRRGEGQVHEVASFDDVDAAVASYLRNINSHRAYADLRAARADLRAANQPVTGNAMANHLLRYSERGLDYVEEIQSMIRVNKLAVLDGV